jgi:hypothetical protein
MLGNGDVVFSATLGRQPDMASGLAGRPIAQRLEPLDEVLPRQIARQLHAAIDSSRVICRRITAGLSTDSK